MQPIGVAGGMSAPAPIPTQQLQTQYTQLMAYIAQQQKALQTCTLVLQAGGSWLLDGVSPGLQLCTLVLRSRWVPRALLGGVPLGLETCTLSCRAGGSLRILLKSQPWP